MVNDHSHTLFYYLHVQLYDIMCDVIRIHCDIKEFFLTKMEHTNGHIREHTHAHREIVSTGLKQFDDCAVIQSLEVITLKFHQ